MTLKEIEGGKGRLAAGGTCVIQNGSLDEFETHPQDSGWTLRPGTDWHIAGSARPTGEVEWCDLR